MVYGRLLYNNIKQYTPKWFKTIPYAQTTQPTFKRLPQRVSFLNRTPVMKIFWKGLRNTFGQYAWSWSLLIFGFAFAWFSAFYYPFIAVYQYNNQNRTYAVAYARERAFKKKKEDEEKLAEEKEAAEAAARGEEQPEEKPEETVVKSQETEEDSGEVAAAGPVGFQAKPVSVSRVKTEDEDEDSAAARRKQKLAALVQKILEQQQRKKKSIAKRQSEQAEEEE